MSHYIFVTMDVDKGDEVIPATDIAKTLLDKRMWAFTAQAPVKQRLQKNEQVLIYIGGKNRHFFIAKAEMEDSLDLANDEECQLLKELGLGYMKEVIRFSAVDFFDTPVKLIPLLETLSFITDTKNYGLHLRLPVREIPKDDFNLILQQTDNQV